jgi:hypothetical protein
MQQRGHDQVGVQIVGHAGEQFGYFEQVIDVRLPRTAFAPLGGVALGGEAGGGEDLADGGQAIGH